MAEEEKMKIDPMEVDTGKDVEAIDTVSNGNSVDALDSVDSSANNEEATGTNATSAVSSMPASGSATPVPVTLTKAQINKQRKSYFLEAQSVLNKRKVADSIKRFKYLIGLTDLFRHFINARAEKDPAFKAMLSEMDVEELHKKNEEEHKKQKQSSTDHRHRKTEKEEDAELLEENFESVSDQPPTVFTESPGYINGTMRDYQIQGLNWMISLYENNISGILADEMGLGKTLQTISFLGYLRYFCGIAGPHIVVVPKSTLDNWRREFAKWTPEVSTLVIQGDKETRGELINGRLLNCDFDVCITSYEMVLREKGQFKKFAWEYIVIDEAHRIKNEESMLSQIIRLFNSRNRLLLTGTPLQNNLHELWALLNFLLPDVFSDSQVFDEWFSGGTTGGIQASSDSANDEKNQDAIVQQLHKVLQPFLLRRVKADVETSLLPKKEVNLYVGMSDMQYRWYQKILEKDIDAVNGAVGKREKTRLLNIVMQLRKCCNHPYLFEGAEPGPPYTTDMHLINNCGKMIVLDKLLKRMREQGSRVLIFSQMSRVLDILEDYCMFRGYKYCRIDGQTAHEDRVAAIDEYNKEGSDKFIFLLTTRAGGLGINLTTADIVVLYDSDWNPQADLQAMDRAHRIGQKKQVYVYRLVTEKAVEEKVLERAAQKLRLDQLVIQQGRQQINAATSQGDLIGMIQHGAEHVMNRTSARRAKKETEEGEEGTPAAETDEFDLDAILSRGKERTQELNAKFSDLGIDDLQRFTSGESAYEWQGQNFKGAGAAGDKKGKKAGVLPKFWINPSKRERKENYSINGYYKDVMSSKAGKAKEKQAAAPKPPKQINIQDHQFYPQRLMDLQEKETAYFRKQQGYKVPLTEGSESDLEERESERQLEQAEIDEAEPLTEQEEQEKQELASEGFGSWTRRDFHHFVQACAKYGRHDIESIAAEFEGYKDYDDVQRYASVFWKRYTEIDGYDRYLSQIDAGEEKIRKTAHQMALLKKKVEMYSTPLVNLEFSGVVGTGKRMYTEEEDRFLTVQMYRFGLDSPTLYEQIRDAIRDSPMFRFDWFFLSRTPIELSRRCATIIAAIVKELEGAKGGSKRKNTPLVSDESEVEVVKKPKKKKTSIVAPTARSERAARRR